jgi:hypothetical protein
MVRRIFVIGRTGELARALAAASWSQGLAVDCRGRERSTSPARLHGGGHHRRKASSSARRLYRGRRRDPGATSLTPPPGRRAGKLFAAAKLVAYQPLLHHSVGHDPKKSTISAG